MGKGLMLNRRKQSLRRRQETSDRSLGLQERQLSRASVWSAPACWSCSHLCVIESGSSAFRRAPIKAGGTAPARSFQTGISTPHAGAKFKRLSQGGKPGGATFFNRVFAFF